MKSRTGMSFGLQNRKLNLKSVGTSFNLKFRLFKLTYFTKDVYIYMTYLLLKMSINSAVKNYG